MCAASLSAATTANPAAHITNTAESHPVASTPPIAKSMASAVSRSTGVSGHCGALGAVMAILSVKSGPAGLAQVNKSVLDRGVGIGFRPAAGRAMIRNCRAGRLHRPRETQIQQIQATRSQYAEDRERGVPLDQGIDTPAPGTLMNQLETTPMSMKRTIATRMTTTVYPVAFSLGDLIRTGRPR